MADSTRAILQEKFTVYRGGRWPDFVQPLFVIAATYFEPDYTIVETYLMKPASTGNGRRFKAERWSVRAELRELPQEIGSLDSIIRDAIVTISARIENEVFAGTEMSQRMMLLGNDRYSLVQDDPSQLFRFKLQHGFGPEMKRMMAVSHCPSLKASLKLVNDISYAIEPLPDPFRELPEDLSVDSATH